VPLKLRGGLYV